MKEMKQRLSLIICCVLLLLSLTINVWLLRENRQLLANWRPVDQRELQIHVSGAVIRPGVYRLQQGARVADALESAGGCLPDALVASLNLAKPLFDGEQINVAQAAPLTTAADSPGSSNESQINLNTATVAELQTLPGIGPAKAQAIVDYRQQHGAFARIEDITKVSGIGAKTFESLKHLITV